LSIRRIVEGVRLKEGDVESAFEEMEKAGVRLISSSEV